MKKNIRYQELPLVYETSGQGLPVMLVHGFTEDRSIWHSLVGSMPEKYRWLVPDLPGSGESVFNRSLHSLSGFADALYAILEAEQVPQAVMIGHSMGGYISLAFAEQYPKALKGLGLFHSTAYADSPEKKEARKKSMEFIRKHGAAPYVEQSLPGLFSEQFKKAHPEKIREQVMHYAGFNPDALLQYLSAMMNREEKTQVLTEARWPVLFIMGEEDKAAPLQDVLKQAHLPAVSDVHILEYTAHMGMLERADLCRGFVDRFLERIVDNKLQKNIS
jgi:pimeloyl-ACP methyl ester carboxylesterase